MASRDTLAGGRTVFRRFVVAGLACTACSGGAKPDDKPQGGPADTYTFTYTDTDTFTDSDTDTDTDTDSDTDTDADTDTGTGTPTDSVGVDPGVLVLTQEGDATVVPGLAYAGLEYFRLEEVYYDQPGALCEFAWLVEDWAASPKPGGTAPGADPSSCSLRGRDCEFTFDLAFTAPTEIAADSDCAAFGVTVDDVEEFGLAYGNVPDVEFAGTTTGGKTYTIPTSDVLMFWGSPDGKTYAWYPQYASVISMYYGLPPTSFDGTDYHYTWDVGYVGYYGGSLPPSH